MNAEGRRKKIVEMLTSNKTPLSGGALSCSFGVSRQIIVQDISILRQQGYDVISTHKGYVLGKTPLVEKVFKVRHTREQTRDELISIVSLGGSVIDVFVWHKVYGKISAPLNIFSIEDVERFEDGIKNGKSVELMNITSGYHYHTIRADNEEIINSIEKELINKNFIVPEK